MKIEPYLPVLGNSKPTLGDLGGLLTFAGVLLMICGAFIFFRRGVWWWQDREDEKSITRLNLK